MASRSERIDDYRRRMRHDMQIVFDQWGLEHCLIDPEEVLNELVDVAMHPIEHLVFEVTT
jgi:hypothetical protein